MGRAANRPRILVIENDPSMQKLLASLLLANGYGARTTIDEAAALRALDDDREAFALAIVDFAPGLNAVETARALRDHPRFGLRPILALACSTRPEDVGQVLGAGCDAYLRKPFHLDEFQDLLVSLTLERDYPELATAAIPG